MLSRTLIAAASGSRLGSYISSASQGVIIGSPLFLKPDWYLDKIAIGRLGGEDLHRVIFGVPSMHEVHNPVAKINTLSMHSILRLTRALSP